MKIFFAEGSTIEKSMDAGAALAVAWLKKCEYACGVCFLFIYNTGADQLRGLNGKRDL